MRAFGAIEALLVALALSLLVVGCDGKKGEAKPEPAAAKADEPKAAPKPEPKPEPKKAEPEPEPEDPLAKWKREPVKGKIPPPEDVKKPPKDAKITEAGVYYKVLQPGTGKDNPTPSSVVTVHYTGWTTKGRNFDSSLKSGEPATFSLSGVIAGWTDGVSYMVKGEKTRFWIPEAMAYKGKPGKPQGMLVFDIELLDFE